VFSGIVEATAVIHSTVQRADVVELSIGRPSSFSDIGVGDSIAVDGICLTLEAYDLESLRFAVGLETLRVTGWGASEVRGKVVNLERSLRLGDRIHGHMVTGHVDCRARILDCRDLGENRTLRIEIPPALAPFIWSKGSVALNGVSLTINAVDSASFSVGLIPETLKRTNLRLLKTGDQIHVEVDNMARGLVHRTQSLETQKL